MQHKISGTTMPVLEITLEPGERIISESGELSWLHGPVQMRTSTGAGASKGGLLSAVKRAVGGGFFWMSEYFTEAQAGAVSFAARAPGVIKEIALDGTRELAIHRHGFVCGTEGVQLDIFFQKKIGVGIFGGEGFLLQKLSGHGTAFVEMHGETVVYELQPGEVLRVHPGHISMSRPRCSCS
jgi:uncharacterized protein (AIM24 family)